MLGTLIIPVWVLPKGCIEAYTLTTLASTSTGVMFVSSGTTLLFWTVEQSTFPRGDYPRSSGDEAKFYNAGVHV